MQKKKLLDQVQDKIRFKHYSIKTEKSYVSWIKRYIYFHKMRHPQEMAKREIEEFLTWLAIEQKISPITQNQAFSAILFLYREILHVNMKDWNIQALSVKRRIKHPHILVSPAILRLSFDAVYLV